MKKHLRISRWFFVVLGIAYGSGHLHTFLITYACLLFHEGMHLFFLCRKNILVRQITLEAFGICIETEHHTPASMAVYLSAPLSNLVLSGMIWLLQKKIPLPFSGDWFYANFILGCFNLLPCLPLDGGRALEIYFCKKHSAEVATQKLNQISLTISALLIAVGLWLLWATKWNISLIIIGIFLLYHCLCQNRFTLCRQVYQRTKQTDFQDGFPKRNIRYLQAQWNLPARKMIPRFQGDDYYIVQVMKNGNQIKTVTETNLIGKMLSGNTNLLLWEC